MDGTRLQGHERRPSSSVCLDLRDVCRANHIIVATICRHVFPHIFQPVLGEWCAMILWWSMMRMHANALSAMAKKVEVATLGRKASNSASVSQAAHDRSQHAERNALQGNSEVTITWPWKSQEKLQVMMVRFNPNLPSFTKPNLIRSLTNCSSNRRWVAPKSIGASTVPGLAPCACFEVVRKIPKKLPCLETEMEGKFTGKWEDHWENNPTGDSYYHGTHHRCPGTGGCHRENWNWTTWCLGEKDVWCPVVAFLTHNIVCQENERMINWKLIDGFEHLFPCLKRHETTN